MTMTARDLIDLDRYPIATPGARRNALLAQVRADLARDGCAVIRDFLTPQGVAAALAEAESVADQAHRSFGRTNAYFTQDDPDLPPEHPKRRFYDRSNAFIPADNFAPAAPLRTIYDAPGFDAFIRDCLRSSAVLSLCRSRWPM